MALVGVLLGSWALAIRRVHRVRASTRCVFDHGLHVGDQGFEGAALVGGAHGFNFFLTPIIWQPSLLPGRALALDVNPFFHFVEVVRAPLLGQAPALLSWYAVLGATAGGWLVTLVLYRRYHGRIAYWI